MATCWAMALAALSSAVPAATAQAVPPGVESAGSGQAMGAVQPGTELPPLDDLRGIVSVTFQETRFDRRTGEMDVIGRVANPTQSDVYAPIVLIFDSFSDPSVELAHFDGVTEGHPYLLVSARAGADQTLSPGETTADLKIRLRNPNRARFTFQTSQRGILILPPPTLDPGAESLTHADQIALTGSAERGAQLEVAGPAGVRTYPVSNNRFTTMDADGGYPLLDNRVNLLFLTTITESGRRSAPATIAITRDNTPPNLYVDFPVESAQLAATSIDVAGRVGDLLSGYGGLTVTVNGLPADVDRGIGNNGTFFHGALPLGAENEDFTITVVATDAVGNSTTRTRTVRRVPIPEDAVRMAILSGNAQDAQPIHSVLPQPIAILMTRPDGTPFTNKVVTFNVIRSDGRLFAAPPGENDAGALMVQVRTGDGTNGTTPGVAQAYWKLGSDAGCGNNRVEVTSTSIAGSIFFCASATPGPAAQINIGSGNNQRVEVNRPAPDPLRAWVSDSCNPIAGVGVTFTVVQGGGKLVGPAGELLDSLTVPTADTGHAAVNYVAGPEAGNQLIEANFAGNPTGPATFVIYALRRDLSQPTSFAGIIMDNSLLPIGGVPCRLLIGGLPGLVCDQQSVFFDTISEPNGQFRFDDVRDFSGQPATGHAHLLINPQDLPPSARLWLGCLQGVPADCANPAEPTCRCVPPTMFPNMHYEVSLTANAENGLGMPVLLPPLNLANERLYSTTSDTVLTCEGMDGLRMIVTAGSMQIRNPADPCEFIPAPSGTRMSLNQVHHDDIPMPMPDGAAPPFAWTLQPAGAHFNPPIRIEYPNMSGLPPGGIANFLSYDHDTNKFEIVASGHVVEDGSLIVTDAGGGLTVSGWGCNCPPYSVTGDIDAECCFNPELSCDSRALSVGSCTCSQVEIDAAYLYVVEAIGWLYILAGGTDAYAADHLARFLLNVPWSASYGAGSRVVADVLNDGSFEDRHTQLKADLQNRVALSLLFDPVPAVADYTRSTGCIGMYYSSIQLAAGIGGINCTASTLSVSNVDIDDVTGDFEADFDYVLRDTFTFDGRGSEGFFTQPAAFLECCREASAGSVTISFSLHVSGNAWDPLPAVSVPPPDPDGSPLYFLTMGIPILRAGSQTAQVPSGPLRIRNVSAADQFGVGGPGTAPDFVSDDPVRVVGVITALDGTLYFTSGPHFISRTITTISDFQFHAVPPPSVRSMTLLMNPEPPRQGSTLIAIFDPIAGCTPLSCAQLSTIATLQDGSTRDVTPRTEWTTYRTSNPAVAMVNENGLVTARGRGDAFITATNDGRSAVTLIRVRPGDPGTMVDGFVVREDGTAVEGARVVVSSQGAEALSDALGHFVISGASAESGNIIVRATAEGLAGTSSPFVPVAGGTTDVGIITMRVPNTQGLEFMVVFEQNYDNTGLTLTLFASSDTVTAGTVQIPGLGYLDTFSVMPGVVTSIPIPADAVMVGSDATAERGILVTADDGINLYGLNRKQFTTDAFAALPVEAFGTRYRVMSHRDHFGSNSNRSQFAVIAAEDDTLLTVTPSSMTAGHPAGQAFQVTLDRLQVYQLRSDSVGDDLTGTLVESDRPVGVFAGHSCGNVPSSSYTACDHLCEQIPPVSTWRNEVITLPLATRQNGDTFRIVADEPGTIVNIAGASPESITLGAGEFAQRILRGNNVISANRPIMVMQFSNGTTYDGVTSDPFMLLVPPVDQFLRAYTFTTPSSGFAINYVNVIAPTADVAAGQLMLDGAPVPAELFQTVAATGFSCAKLPIALGSHSIGGPNPLGIYVYGFADADSYGYPGGLSLGR